MSGPARGWFDSVLAATALALVVLLPLEVVSWLVLSDPAGHDANWVADRWDSAAWRAVDWVFLLVALVHGGASTIRWLLHGRSLAGWRPVAAGLLVSVCVALAILGSYTVFTYEIA